MIGLIPLRYWSYIGIAGGLVLGAWYTYQVVENRGYDRANAAWDADKLIQAAAALKASEEARAKEQEHQATITKANHDAKKREVKLAADGATARLISSGLSSDLATVRLQIPGLARAAVDRYASTASIVFEGCVREYINVAGSADQSTSDAVKLQQAWPK